MPYDFFFLLTNLFMAKRFGVGVSGCAGHNTSLVTIEMIDQQNKYHSRVSLKFETENGRRENYLMLKCTRSGSI